MLSYHRAKTRGRISGYYNQILILCSYAHTLLKFRSAALNSLLSDGPGVFLPTQGQLPVAITPTSTGAGEDLPNLDLLRTVAVVCVLVSHTLSALNRVPEGFWYGGFGVAMFFVHTALVLMWSLDRRPNTLQFYIRRIARVYPLAILVVLLTVLTHAPVNAFTRDAPFFRYLAPTWGQVVTHLLLIQNFFSGSFIVYPMWSLPLEVQMYAVLPLLFFFLRKKLMLWPLLVLWTIAVGFAHKTFGLQQVNLVVAVPYFLPGLMAYVGFSKWKPVFPGWTFLPALAAIVWVGGHAGDWQRAWIPCLALGLMLPLFRQLRPSLLTKASWQIARYSYGIYLMHPFALVLAFYVCRNFGRPVQFAVLFTSLIVLSVGAFHLIEAPFMRLGAKVANAAGRRFKMQAASEQPCELR